MTRTISMLACACLLASLQFGCQSTGGAGDLKRIGARHILVSYKGAMRSRKFRSKKEAKARIKEALEKVESGADFASVALRYSDCPSGMKGGNLGSFDKGTMHKNFESAAWKLDVGEVSGIIQTPFGYHIIKRTR